MSEKKFAVGQKWKRRDGEVVTVEALRPDEDISCRVAAGGHLYCDNGMFYSTGNETVLDLVTLVEDVASEQAAEPNPEAIADGILSDAAGLIKGEVLRFDYTDNNSRQLFVDELFLVVAPKLAGITDADDAAAFIAKLVEKRDALLAKVE